MSLHPATVSFRRRLAESERLRYLLVGGYNTAFGWTAFFVLYSLLHKRLHYMGILVLAHLVSVLNAFVGYRLVVFRSKEPVVTSGLRFSLVYLVVVAANLVMLPPMVTIMGGRVVPAQAIVIAITVVFTYLAHRNFSFRGRVDSPRERRPVSTRPG